jgi:uncharacterized membrane protein YgdD (TMEM256/DUF423 family)
MARTFAIWGSVLAFLAVALGAFGAHALRDRLSVESLAIYQTGVQYQMTHALGLLILSAFADRVRSIAMMGWLFVFGVLLFSGSLYLLAITGYRWMGAITPFGGICFLSGWALFAVDLIRGPRVS